MKIINFSRQANALFGIIPDLYGDKDVKEIMEKFPEILRKAKKHYKQLSNYLICYSPIQTFMFFPNGEFLRIRIFLSEFICEKVTYYVMRIDKPDPYSKQSQRFLTHFT